MHKGLLTAWEIRFWCRSLDTYASEVRYGNLYYSDTEFSFYWDRIIRVYEFRFVWVSKNNLGAYEIPVRDQGDFVPQIVHSSMHGSGMVSRGDWWRENQCVYFSLGGRGGQMSIPEVIRTRPNTIYEKDTQRGLRIGRLLIYTNFIKLILYCLTFLISSWIQFVAYSSRRSFKSCSYKSPHIEMLPNAWKTTGLAISLICLYFFLKKVQTLHTDRIHFAS